MIVGRQDIGKLIIGKLDRIDALEAGLSQSYDYGNIAENLFFHKKNCVGISA